MAGYFQDDCVSELTILTIDGIANPWRTWDTAIIDDKLQPKTQFLAHLPSISIFLVFPNLFPK